MPLNRKLLFKTGNMCFNPLLGSQHVKKTVAQLRTEFHMNSTCQMGDVLFFSFLLYCISALHD